MRFTHDSTGSENQCSLYVLSSCQSSFSFIFISPILVIIETFLSPSIPPRACSQSRISVDRSTVIPYQLDSVFLMSLLKAKIVFKYELDCLQLLKTSLSSETSLIFWCTADVLGDSSATHGFEGH